MEFSEIVKKRYATKKFDGTTLPQEKVDALLEIIKLSASSFGLQPYKINIVTDDTTREKLQAAAWNQPQITTCSHLLVFCAYKDAKKRIDQYEEMIGKETAPDYIGMMRGTLESKKEEDVLAWAKNQTYIAVGNAINGAKSLGFDSCPMEGFDAKAFKEILELDETLEPCVLVPIGIAADEPRPKIRYPNEELFI